MSDLKKILANADKMSSDMKQIVENIRKGKGTIGKILVEDDIADDVKATLSSVKRMIKKVDNIRTELSMFTGANSVSGGDTEASLVVFPSPERYYLFGMTNSEYSPYIETHTTTSINGGSESTEIERRRKKDTVRFNVQVGRKLHKWSFRGGLIESTGGLGVDYEKMAWGSRFSMDAFDYRDNIGINLRFSYQLQLWNILYSKISFGDVITEGRNATVSAGLKFNDEDLKGLLGFFF
jgi:phospholipid/cholesterol/gamma-HCH transport system substrate-binding protein